MEHRLLNDGPNVARDPFVMRRSACLAAPVVEEFIPAYQTALVGCYNPSSRTISEAMRDPLVSHLLFLPIFSLPSLHPFFSILFSTALVLAIEQNYITATPSIVPAS
jgi:hypothetical protein